MKVEGKDVTEHPVLFKLTATKGLLDQLKPLDAKLDIQIKKHKRGNTALLTQSSQSEEDAEEIESE